MFRIYTVVPIGGALITLIPMNNSGCMDPAVCGWVCDKPVGAAGFARVICGGTLWAAAFFCAEKRASTEK